MRYGRKQGQGWKLGGPAEQRLSWDRCTPRGLAKGETSLPRRCGVGKGRLFRAQVLQVTMACKDSGSLPNWSRQLGNNPDVLETARPQNLFQRTAGTLWTPSLYSIN